MILETYLYKFSSLKWYICLRINVEPCALNQAGSYRSWSVAGPWIWPSSPVPLGILIAPGTSDIYSTTGNLILFPTHYFGYPSFFLVALCAKGIYSTGIFIPPLPPSLAPRGLYHPPPIPPSFAPLLFQPFFSLLFLHLFPHIFLTLIWRPCFLNPFNIFSDPSSSLFGRIYPCLARRTHSKSAW